MNINWIGLAVAACLVTTLGCAEKGNQTSEGSSTPAAASDGVAPASDANATEHAPAGVVPGSYEDWCGEHGVPESVCTRCNADLIPAFQATGDWCAEHGLPESQCLTCNPGLVITRPAKT